MRNLSECTEELHTCSKCGLCQSVCPIYKITGNECTVSKGHFIMLNGLLKGKLKMSSTINRYLDLCIKCGACTKFCPSGIDVVEIISLAKAEYFKMHKFEKLKTDILQLMLGVLNIVNKFSQKKKSDVYEKKVIYFGGCGSMLQGNKHVVEILNAMKIEVITPEFGCCGYPFLVSGDIEKFKLHMDKNFSTLQKYENYDIVTNCATCEKSLKLYSKWTDKKLNIKNMFEYIRENNLNLELKKKLKVTFHKPCNMDNYDDVKWIINNTKNLEYVEMNDYDKCCGFAGITNLKEHNTMSELFKEKYMNIKNTGANTVLTSCVACQSALNLFSRRKYKVADFIEFLSKNCVRK